MTISLKIDNIDSLPDGGPLSFTARNRGFDIGREQHLDWTLPDPNRMISGRHCEIRFENGAYWLYDISRNGTFLNGASTRVKSPYRLADGDRLQIGHYVIAVSVAPGAAAVEEEPASPFGAAAPASPGAGLWDTGEPAPPPISRRDLMPPKRNSRAADFSEQYLQLPPVDTGFAATPPPFPPAAPAAMPPMPQAAPMPPMPGAPVAAQPFVAPPVPQSPFGPAAAPAVAPVPPVPPAAAPFLGESEPFAPPRPPRAAPPAASAPRMPQAAPLVVPQQSGQDGAGILARIAAGAGIAPDAFMQRDAGEVAEEIGAVLRLTVEELAQLLKARAAAKVLARSSNRTMISAVDNNPLKFIPDAGEIIEIMFAHRRAGYLDARRSVEESFKDLKTHEFATYAAMQKALARLLEDLSPDTIEKKVASSTFASRKGRAWDTFVATWEAKAESHENGMLDIFLSYFADAYEKASKSS